MGRVWYRGPMIEDGRARKMQTRIRNKIKGAIGRLAALSGVVTQRYRSKLIIVAFHRVNDALPEDGLTHGSEKFEQYCEFFRRNFRIVPVSEQIAGCNSGNDVGGTLSITFDDGYRDNYEVAAPILRRLNLPATFFITTGFIGSQTIAPWDHDLVRQPGWMDWEQVRSLISQGFEIGCHTASHIDLGTADDGTTRLELETSKRKLHEELGRPVLLFAYPFGGQKNMCERSLKLVREAGFICCLSCFGGVNTSKVSPFELKRIPIARGFGDPDQFGFDLVFGRVAQV